MENEMEESIEYRSLSENQKKLVAILPIPSAILSLIGSSMIVYMAMRSRRNPHKKWTPYNRLVMGMSFFDILTSVTLTVASFLYPKETSTKAWVIGNETTCSAVGALNQLIYGVILYYGALSVYFLLTTKFGFCNRQIAHRIEPFIHIFCFGYPLVTSFVGLFLGAYDEPELGIGCWVKRWPKRCIAYRDPVGSEEACRSKEVGWALGGWVGAGAPFLSFVCTVVIFFHVRQQEKLTMQTGTKNSPNNDTRRSSTNRSSMFKTEMLTASMRCDGQPEPSESSDVMAQSVRTNYSLRTVPPSPTPLNHRTEQMRQLKRLKLVRNQAFLYMLSYYCTTGWSQLLRLVESQADSMVAEKELPYDFYILLLGQCILYPLQGFTNWIVFIRPKYLALRGENPDQTRLWVLERVIFDDDLLDTSPSSTTERGVTDSMHSNNRPPRHPFLNEDYASHRPPSSVDLNNNSVSDVASLPPQSPFQCEHSPTETKSLSTGATVVSFSSLASSAAGDDEMKEVMERTKRRLEKYKADRLTKTPSQSSGLSSSLSGAAAAGLRDISESSDGSENVLEFMSPIQKVRAKLKLQAMGILASDEEEEGSGHPRPVPETTELSPKKGKGLERTSSAVQMDGSIVRRPSAEFVVEDANKDTIIVRRPSAEFVVEGA